MTQPSLIQFEVEYAAYKDKFDEVNAGCSGSNVQPQKYVRQCLKPDLLHSSRMIGAIEGASTVEEASDTVVKTWFESRLTDASKEIS